MSLVEQGFGRFHPQLETALLDEVAACAFTEGQAGSRCLLDLPAVARLARALKARLVDASILPASAVAIQAISFDKTAATNWKVPWHQDVQFPFASPVSSEGYDQASVKGGVNFARPPRAVLEALLAVRLHLDECGLDNGPLRVSPGSHRRGVLRAGEIAACVAECGEAVCVAEQGEALLMKPLLLHASSPAQAPRNRRVVHFVYYCGPQMAERWQQALS